MWWQLLPTSVGIWLMFAPWAFGYEGQPAEMNDRIVGPFIACFAIIATGEVTRNVRFWNLPLGVWMLVSPLLITYPDAGMISAILAGIATIALPFNRRKISGNYAGGWMTLWRRDPFDVAHGSADQPANESAARHVDT